MGSLETAMEALHVAASDEERPSDWIDDHLHDPRTLKRKRKSLDEVKHDITQRFLTPPTTFSTEWLNKLQQRPSFPIDYTDMFQLAPTQSRTVTRFTREGLDGRVTGYKEVTVPASSATAKNSTSILRKPASRADFVRGAPGYLPFLPGGLDGVEAVAKAEEEQFMRDELVGQRRKREGINRVIEFGVEGGLLEVPPGFKRGCDFTAKQRQGKDENDAEEVQQILEEAPEEVPAEAEAEDAVDQANGHVERDAVEKESESDDDDDELDSLLPVEFPALAARGNLAPSKQRRGKEWAHMVDVNRQMPNFRELVPEMAREWPFELDTFQKEAVYHLESGDSVFVAAHTSAGKTVVAEYAIALAAQHMTKAIYTSPIKALSNQKFRDFQQTFEDVGILTGDVQIRPEASCLIMTTEILRSMLYRGADLIRDVEYVIFDEVHYVNDLERGVVWEEVIIMLPEYVTLILLSATVPNTYEFASWVGRTKKKDIYVISTPKRPVPLQHFLWAGKGTHMIVDSDKKLIEKGWKEANDVLSGRDKIKADAAKQAANASTRGQAQGQRGAQRGGQRGGPQQRGRGQPAQRGHGNIARTGRGGGRTTAAQDRTLWVGLVQYLRKEDLLPTCIFVFSKKRCEENADALANLDFSTAAEKSATHMIVEKSIARLKPEDRQLPQIIRIRELLSRGIAVHHGGLLPIVKEVVEILFAKTLVKVLFATETFAMGLNLPTRTVVFSGYRKHDGRQFRDLLPGEYTQMAGRAGRRGLDPVGSVIIVAPGAEEAPPAATLRNMILGDPTKLRSQFRLTYNMILNLLRVEALKIEEMIKRSFSENATQALLPEQEKAVKISEEDLAKIKREPCDICDVDLEQCHDACLEYERLTNELLLGLLASPVGRRMFIPKRLIVYRKDGIRTVGVLLREGIGRGFAPTLSVMEITDTTAKRQSADLLPYLPAFRALLPPLSTSRSHYQIQHTSLPLSSVECLTQTLVKSEISASPTSTSSLLTEILSLCNDWTSPSLSELDFSKIRDIAVHTALTARNTAASTAQSSRALSHCPNFLKHFAQLHDEHLIRTHISSLKQLMSDQNLQLLPDYEQRISVLKDLHFIDSASRVELKGKVACELHTADELVLTELILENTFADYDPAQIAALLSAFVFQEKTDVVPNLTPQLEQGKAAIIAISERVNAVQTLHQVLQPTSDSNDFVSRPRFGLVEVIYNWALGMSFQKIMELTDVLEGTIVRVVSRLEECLREVRGAARVVGDPVLYEKMGRAGEMVGRDVCKVASLYM